MISVPTRISRLLEATRRRSGQGLRARGLIAAIAASCLGSVGEIRAAEWRPATEQEWAISAITRDLLDLSRFATDAKGWAPVPAGALRVVPAPATPGVRFGTRYTVQFPAPAPAREFVIVAGSNLWDPTPYAALLVADSKLAPGKAASTPADEKEMLVRLAGLAGREYVTENRRLSSYLSENPTDPALHEQAALLLAALALRENSGAFWDPRQALNRAVAHLAFSRLLRRAAAPGTDSGALAELLVGLIIDTKADCVRRVAELKARAQGRPELMAWVRAAEIRNSRDYRLLTDPGNATPLERVECFRALCEAVDPGVAVQRLREFKIEKLPDWSRTVLQFGLRVGDGHIFSRLGLPMEMVEMREAFPQATSPAALIAALNLRAGNAVHSGKERPEIVVLDAGLWGEFHQRHLLHVGVRSWDFYQNSWGVPEKAEEFATAFRKQFGQLWLFPLAELDMDAGRQGSDSRRGPVQPVELSGPRTLVRDWPEKVTEAHFRTIRRNDGGAEDTGQGRAWFNPPVPEGTALSALWRVHYYPAADGERRAELERLHAIAPLIYDLAVQLLRSRTGNRQPTRAEFDRVIGPFLGYHHRALRLLAGLRETSPEESLKIYEKLAKEDPNELLALANRYKTFGRKDEAIATYERAITEMPDSVAVSNSLDWLVDELFQRGEKARAEKAAEFGAKVYSSRGLATMARLQEKLERWDRAEEYLRMIDQRYKSRGPLQAFYLRRAQAEPNGPYAAKAKAETAQLFPSGQRSVTLAEFTSPPKRGVIVQTTNAATDRAGLKRGDIIVAIDGIAVESMEQYSYVRSLKEAAPLELIVWHGQNYRPISASAPGRTFGVEFRSWQAP